MSLPTTEDSRLPLDRAATPRPQAWPWMAGLLALAAASICVYLAWAAIAAGGRVAGCGDGGGDCASVLLSRWARWFDLPVSVPAALVYGLVLAALCALPRSAAQGRSFRVWYVLVPLATLVLLAASWFTALQLLVLGKLCWYCLAAHGCGVALALILFWNVPHDWRLIAEPGPKPVGLSPATTLGLVACGFLGAGLLISGQLLSKAPEPEVEITTLATAETSPPAVEPVASTSGQQAIPGKASTNGKQGAADDLPTDLSNYFPAREVEPGAGDVRPRRVSLIGGKAILDARRTPLLGQPDAETVIVELFDYTCPHCRRLHHYLSEARERYGAQFAVAVLVTPMDPSCNQYVHDPATEPGSCELARLAVAVWQNRPAAFAEFHEWMMGSAVPPSIAAARARAIEILGGGEIELTADVLDRILADEAITRQIEADNRIYQLAGAGTIPKLLTERTIIAGEPASAVKLFEVLEQQIGLQPAAPSSR